MLLRNLRSRIRDTRSGDTTDPLDRRHAAADLPEPEPADPWIDAITPPVGEDTDPGGADLASADPNHEPAPGAIRTAQTLYGPDVRRCGVIGCGTHTTGEICVKCTAGRLPPEVDGHVPPYLERILPDPPLGYPRVSFLTEAILDDIGDYDDYDDGSYEKWGILPDPPLRLDGAGYVLEPLPDVADFEEARDRLRAYMLERTHRSCAPTETAPTVGYLNRMLSYPDGAA